MSKMKNKVTNYKNTLSRLREGIAKFDEENDLLRDGLIQRFKFTESSTS